MWKAQWGVGDDTQGASLAELDALLDKLHGKCGPNQPILVAVESTSGNTLIIGIGGEMSVLSFIPGNAEPPYLSSVGTCQEEGLSVFYFMGEWTEIPRRKLIPLALARQVMRSFLATGKLAEDLTWEED